MLTYMHWILLESSKAWLKLPSIKRKEKHWFVVYHLPNFTLCFNVLNISPVWDILIISIIQNWKRNRCLAKISFQICLKKPRENAGACRYCRWKIYVTYQSVKLIRKIWPWCILWWHWPPVHQNSIITKIDLHTYLESFSELLNLKFISHL
jgi:hypothetical protein